MVSRIVEQASLIASDEGSPQVQREHLEEAVDRWAIPNKIIDYNPFRSGVGGAKLVMHLDRPRVGAQRLPPPSISGITISLIIPVEPYVDESLATFVVRATARNHLRGPLSALQETGIKTVRLGSLCSRSPAWRVP